MKIAIVRGAFGNPYELQNWEPLAGKHEITVFVSQNNRSRCGIGMTVEKLFSPYDYLNRIGRGVFNRLFTDAHYLIGLEEKLKGFDIAICAETYYAYTQQCLNAKKKGDVKKVISTVWENIPFNNESLRGRKEFKQRAIEEVDRFIAVTQKAKGVLIAEGCDPEKISVIPMGVDLDRFRLRDDSGRGQNDTLTVLFVGRPVREKGYDFLSNLKIKNCELKIVSGGVPYDQMPKVYQEADIFVHPAVGSSTWQEQFGMVLVEAMASGLPIVTTDCGSIPEVIGNAGIISKNIEQDLKMLVENISLRIKLGKMARARAEKYFDRRKISQLYENILH